MVLPATASLLPIPRIDAARVGGTALYPATRDIDGHSTNVRQVLARKGVATAEVAHVFDGGLYLAVEDPHSSRGPGRHLLPIMGSAALLLPFGISVPQLGREHLATLKVGTHAGVLPAASPMQLGSRPPIFEDHVLSPRWIEFPDFALEIVRSHRPLRVKTQPWWALDSSTLAVLASNLRPGLSDLPSRAGVLASSLLNEDVVDIEVGVRALIGAGPGSTPSGDDALSGIALALRSTGKNSPLELLSHTIESVDLTQATPALSSALIRAAVSGHCVPEVAAAIEAARRLLTASGNETAAAETLPIECAAVLSPLDLVGHSSGHDLFTGFLAVLTAFTCSRLSRPSSSSSFQSPRPPSTAVAHIRGRDGFRNPARTPTQHYAKGTQSCHAP